MYYLYNMDKTKIQTKIDEFLVKPVISVDNLITNINKLKVNKKVTFNMGVKRKCLNELDNPPKRKMMRIEKFPVLGLDD